MRLPTPDGFFSVNAFEVQGEWDGEGDGEGEREGERARQPVDDEFDFIPLDLGPLAIAPHLALYLSVLILALLTVDHRRSLGLLPGLLSMIAGATFLAFSLYLVFLYRVPASPHGNGNGAGIFQQIGPLLLAIGGTFLVLGGFLLLARWMPLPAKARGPALSELPRACGVIALVCAAAFVLLAFRQDYAAVLRQLGFIGASSIIPAHAHTLLTYILLHGDFWHLLLNIVLLLSLGGALEERIGRAGVLVLFGAGALAGAATSALLAPVASQPLVGASGGTFAMTAGAMLVAAPQAEARLWLYFGVHAVWLRMKVVTLGALALLVEATRGLLTHDVLTAANPWAWLGGLGVGAIAGLIIQRMKKLPEAKAEADPDDDTPAAHKWRMLTPALILLIALATGAAGVAVSFSNRSFLRAAGNFERAWNSGEMAAIRPFFVPERRDVVDYVEHQIRLHDPHFLSGRTMLRLAVKGTRPLDDTGGDFFEAIFRLAPSDVDVFRTPASGSVKLSWQWDESRGRWYIYALKLDFL